MPFALNAIHLQIDPSGRAFGGYLGTWMDGTSNAMLFSVTGDTEESFHTFRRPPHNCDSSDIANWHEDGVTLSTRACSASFEPGHDECSGTVCTDTADQRVYIDCDGTFSE